MANTVKAMSLIIIEDSDGKTQFQFSANGFSKFELLGLLDKQKHEILNDID